jgi:oligopeptide transport system ATP-binding protein
MTGDTLLELKNINKTFLTASGRKLPVLGGVSLEIKKGECLGIVGESGSGKSTLAKAALRLINVDSGSIFFHGMDITAIKGSRLREVYRNIQMVFQYPADSFDPGKTLGYGICEVMRNQGLKAEEIKSKMNVLLKECGLDESFADKYPHEVSGGQCQKAAIVRALIPEPELIICDEATSALDMTVQKQITDLLKRLKKEKAVSIMFICHNMALMQQICDRAVVMENGHIVEEGTPEDIIYSPKSEYTKLLISSVLDPRNGKIREFAN